MRNAMLLLGFAGLAACRESATEPPDVAALVRIVDQDGAPLRPDLVTWFHDPLGTRFDGEHPAECRDPDCTWWIVPAEGRNAAYVAASRVRPVPGREGCAVLGYDGKPVAPSTQSPPTVVLRLNTRGAACP
ncbi:MAG TPA: hypothetical protein VM759_12975 [Longimicrobium sp.]|nr:hypothetical protein [Longimicrobium sp.]